MRQAGLKSQNADSQAGLSSKLSSISGNTKDMKPNWEKLETKLTGRTHSIKGDHNTGQRETQTIYTHKRESGRRGNTWGTQLDLI